MDEELVQFVRLEHAARKEWLAQAKRMRDAADRMDSRDAIMATKLRRAALSIEQLQEHVEARLLELAMDALDTKQNEVDQLVNDMLKKLGAK